jgi:hypothetical protein
MVKVRNMQSSRGNDVPNQFIIESGKSIYFQSYQTVIAKKTLGKTVLDKNAYDYSVTTMKYLNYFLGHNMKETRERINTGEYKLRDLNK